MKSLKREMIVAIVTCVIAICSCTALVYFLMREPDVEGAVEDVQESVEDLRDEVKKDVKHRGRKLLDRLTR